MNEAMAAPVAADASNSRTWFGQPKGVAYLSMTECWERFSFYGMRTLLILYMVQQLLLPGHIEHVAGMRGFRTFLEGLLGPMSTQAFASQVFGIYSGMVYFTPMFGGWLADRWLGPKRVVLAGIALMTVGHFAMAFEQSVLIALTLLVLGSGCLKGNIAAQVGQLYAADDETRRAQGFTIFSTGINIGATLGPFVCGIVSQIYGWDIAFGTAGVMMLVAAVIYLAGQRHFVSEDHARAERQAQPSLDGDAWRRILLVTLVLLIGLLQGLGYDQMYNVGLIWVEERVNNVTEAGAFPTAWFASVDGLTEVLVVPAMLVLWRWQARRGAEPDDFGKMAIGSAVMALGSAALALGSATAGGGKAALWYPMLAFILAGVSFMWVWPVTLAVVSRHAPLSVRALMMAGAYLSGFATGFGSGYLARFYEPLGPAAFWWLMTAISTAGAILFVLVAPWLRRAFRRLEIANA